MNIFYVELQGICKHNYSFDSFHEPQEEGIIPISERRETSLDKNSKWQTLHLALLASLNSTDMHFPTFLFPNTYF